MLHRIFILVLVVLILPIPALAASRTCTRSLDPPRIDQSITLCADNFYPAGGISITADNIVLDCGSAVLKGNFKNTGITINGRTHVTIRNCQVANYDAGILIRNSRDIRILNGNLLRNMIGLKLIDSSGVVVENTHDISIKRPVQLINSNGNSFQFINKKIEGDECRLNQCNTPTGMAASEQARTKAELPKKTLRRFLNDALRSWLTGTA